ncbi:hypothetical protein FRC00_002070, partial [Tulasnella sp. 408]
STDDYDWGPDETTVTSAPTASSESADGPLPQLASLRLSTAATCGIIIGIILFFIFALATKEQPASTASQHGRHDRTAVDGLAEQETLAVPDGTPLVESRGGEARGSEGPASSREEEQRWFVWLHGEVVLGQEEDGLDTGIGLGAAQRGAFWSRRTRWCYRRKFEVA